MDRHDYDPRSPMSYIFDLNLMDSFESLLQFRRDDLLGQFKTGLLDVDEGRKEKIDNLVFWHICFNDIDPGIKDHSGESLQSTLNRIPTNFGIEDDEMKRIDKAVDLLIHRNHPMLKKIMGILY